MAEPRMAGYGQTIVSAKKNVIGINVVNSQNEDLGKVEDVVLDASAGRVACAVLSFGGFLGMGDKLFAIPWNAFSFDVNGKRAVLNVSKQLLENAPGFSKDNWPNMADQAWASGVFGHYGYTPYWEESSFTTRNRM